jgi:hypothetical protein
VIWLSLYVSGLGDESCVYYARFSHGRLQKIAICLYTLAVFHIFPVRARSLPILVSLCCANHDAYGYVQDKTVGRIKLSKRGLSAKVPRACLRQ